MEVIIAAEHPVIRVGLSMLIRKEFNRNAAIVFCHDCDEAMRLIELRKGGGVTMLIADIQDSGITDLVETDIMRGDYDDLRILLLGDSCDAAYTCACIAMGAHGYLSKRETTSVFRDAIAMVLAGRVFPSQYEDRAVFPHDLLSKREKAIVECLVNGYSLREVSEVFDIAYTTVSTYKKRAFIKLGINNLPMLIQFVHATKQRNKLGKLIQC